MSYLNWQSFGSVYPTRCNSAQVTPLSSVNNKDYEPILGISSETTRSIVTSQSMSRLASIAALSVNNSVMARIDTDNCVTIQHTMNIIKIWFVSYLNCFYQNISIPYKFSGSQSRHLLTIKIRYEPTSYT